MSLTDFLKGSEKKIKADPLAGDINAAGKSGLNFMNSAANNLNEKFYNNPDSYVNNQIDRENNAIRSATEDAKRRTRQLITQRGMGASSIGLGQEVNLNRDLNQNIALNNASGMDRIRALLNDQMSTGQKLFNTKIQGNQNLQMQDVKYRSGGLAPLVGAGIGGYFGGAQGAQAGAGIGQMYANS